METLIENCAGYFAALVVVFFPSSSLSGSSNGLFPLSTFAFGVVGVAALTAAASVNGLVSGTFVSNRLCLPLSCSSSSSSRSEYVVTWLERCVNPDWRARLCVSTLNSDAAREAFVVLFSSRDVAAETCEVAERIDAASAAVPTPFAVFAFLSFRMILSATGFMVFRFPDAFDPSDDDEGILIITGLTLFPPCFAKSTLGTGGVDAGVEPLDPTLMMAALPPMTCVAGIGLITPESRKIVEAMDVRASEGAMDPGRRPSDVVADISLYVLSRRSPGMKSIASEKRELVLEGVPTADGIGGTGGTRISLPPLPLERLVTPGI